MKKKPVLEDEEKIKDIRLPVKLEKEMNLCPGEVRLMVRIKFRAWTDGYCFETIETMSEAVGMHEKTVEKHLFSLIRLNIVRVVYLKDYKKTRYTGIGYTLNDYALWFAKEKSKKISKAKATKKSAAIKKASHEKKIIELLENFSIGQEKFSKNTEKNSGKMENISEKLENFSTNSTVDGHVLPIAAKPEVNTSKVDPFELNHLNKYIEKQDHTQTIILEEVQKLQILIREILERQERLEEKQRKIEISIEDSNKDNMQEILSIIQRKFLSKEQAENLWSLKGEESQSKETNSNSTSTIKLEVIPDTQIRPNLNENKSPNTEVAEAEEKSATAKIYPLEQKNKIDSKVASHLNEKSSLPAVTHAAVAAVAVCAEKSCAEKKEISAPSAAFVLADEKQMITITSAENFCKGLKKVFKTSYINTPFLGRIFRELHEVDRMSYSEFQRIRSLMMEHTVNNAEFFKEVFEPFIFRNEGGFGEDADTSRHYSIFKKNLKHGFLNYESIWHSYEEKQSSEMKKAQAREEAKSKKLEEIKIKEIEAKQKKEDEYISKRSLLSSLAQEFVAHCEKEVKMWQMINIQKEIKCRTASEFDDYLSQDEGYKKWILTRNGLRLLSPIPLAVDESKYTNGYNNTQNQKISSNFYRLSS